MCFYIFLFERQHGDALPHATRPVLHPGHTDIGGRGTPGGVWGRTSERRRAASWAAQGGWEEAVELDLSRFLGEFLCKGHRFTRVPYSQGVPHSVLHTGTSVHPVFFSVPGADDGRVVQQKSCIETPKKGLCCLNSKRNRSQDMIIMSP